jgi:hypothetical protein
MQPDRRKHRAPFVADGPTIRTANGLPVGTMITSQIASFAATSMSFFDRLSAAVRVCKGEHENDADIQMTPAYRELVKLVDDYENALRGTNN